MAHVSSSCTEGVSSHFHSSIQGQGPAAQAPDRFSVGLAKAYEMRT